jgi:hypothetical protein
MITEPLNIITGKITTESLGVGATSPKKMYIKIFLGAFTLRPPRLKQAKVLLGELLVKYSNREWPEKKHGPLVGDKGVLSGIGQLLLNEGYVHITDISYAQEQRELKETLTLKVGSKLSEEFVKRGLVVPEESLVPLASRVVDPEPNLDTILPPVVRDVNFETDVEQEFPNGFPLEGEMKVDDLPKSKAVKKLPAVKLETGLLDLQPLEKAPTPKKVVKLTATKVVKITKNKPSKTLSK